LQNFFIAPRIADTDELTVVMVRFPQLQFQYRDPERGFDRRAVHGLVARLITVKDPASATALEVLAGGKVSSGWICVCGGMYNASWC